MDERLKKYLEIVENTVDIDPPGKEVIEAWIEHIVDGLQKMMDLRRQYAEDLPFGKFLENEGAWENEISVCGFGPSWFGGRIQIYTGLDYIAKVLGLDLECEKREGSQYRYEYSCRYKDYELYQIEDQPLSAVDGMITEVNMRRMDKE